jgi:hypothetical protein
MKRHSDLLGYLVFAAAAVFTVSASARSNQNSAAPQGKKYAPPKLSSDRSKPAPRAADGHPDLSGMWIEKYGALGADPAAGKPAQPRTAGSAEASAYPTDALPYQPWAAEKAKQLHDAENTDPLLHCEPYGMPRIWGGPHPARLVQLPGELIILYERDTSFRIIPTDGRPHPDPADIDPSWMGNSVAKWDGDTLVIDTIGLTDKSWLGTGKSAGEGSATFHSDALHVTERIRRPDFDHLAVEITNDDPKVFTHPWVFTWNMTLAPNEQMYEDVTCSNEKDYQHQMPDKPAAADPGKSARN